MHTMVGSEWYNSIVQRKRGKEEGREEGREERRDGGKEGRRKRGREGGREDGREGGREEGWDDGREGGNERGREGPTWPLCQGLYTQISLQHTYMYSCVHDVYWDH